MLYFIYKPIFTQEYGEILPGIEYLFEDEVQLELSIKRGYRLGKCKKPENIWKIQEFILLYITEDLAEGFKLIDVNYKIEFIPKETTEENETTQFYTKYTNLTKEEKQKQKEAEELLSLLDENKYILQKVKTPIEFSLFLLNRISQLENLLLDSLLLFNNTSRKLDIVNKKKEYKKILKTLIELKNNKIDIDDYKLLIKKENDILNMEK